MKRKTGIKIVIVFCLIIISVFTYFYSVVVPVIKSFCKTEVEASIRNAINESNETIVKKAVGYDDIFTVVYSSEKEVVSVRANMGLINQISMLWGTEIQNHINGKNEIVFKKPAGVFSGSVFLSKFGKDISLHCTYTAISKTDYRSEFIRRGVNQTLHRLYLDAQVEATLLSPYSSETLIVYDSFLFSESVINGKVPQTYISSENYGEYLDLLDR